MTTPTTTVDLPEETLRCEYFVRLSGRYVEIACLKGAFDMPMALGKGYLGGSFYRTYFCLRTLNVVAGEAVRAAYNEYCREQVEASP